MAVADWSQAKIGYTKARSRLKKPLLRIGLRPRLVTLKMITQEDDRRLRIGLRPRLVTLRTLNTAWHLLLRIGLRPRLVTLEVPHRGVTTELRIGLRPRLVTLLKIQDTERTGCGLVSGQDWLHCSFRYDCSEELRIGLRPRLVTLDGKLVWLLVGLRIGLRPRLVTLSTPSAQRLGRCGLVSGQDWLHLVASFPAWTARCGLVSGQDWLH